MRLLPRSHIPSRFVENSYVIVLCDLARRHRAELLQSRRQTSSLFCALVAAIEEAVKICSEKIRSHFEVLWSIHDVRCDDWAPLQVDIDVPEDWIREHLVECQCSGYGWTPRLLP